jgi:hypothetical protein
MASNDRGYGSLLSVKMNHRLRDDLDRIAIFEHRKLSELVREWLSDKVDGYEKRPDYKHFLKQLEEKMVKGRGE